MWGIILIIIAIIALSYVSKWIKGTQVPQSKQKDSPHTRTQDTEETQDSDKKDYTRCYQRKYLLTKNEYQAYKSLKIILEKYKMIACPKVRLLDIVEPINGDHYKGALGKIQSKHVDFVICDKDLYIKGILELDDNSHNLPERQERDQFVDAVLRNVGYNVIRVKYITEETIKELLPSNTQEYKQQ